MTTNTELRALLAEAQEYITAYTKQCNTLGGIPHAHQLAARITATLAEKENGGWISVDDSFCDPAGQQVVPVVPWDEYCELYDQNMKHLSLLLQAEANLAVLAAQLDAAMRAQREAENHMSRELVRISLEADKKVEAAESRATGVPQGRPVICKMCGDNVDYYAGDSAPLPDAEEVRELTELLKAASCPSCNGSGITAILVEPGVWEPDQCQWCYERYTLLGKLGEKT